jgi:hypothetical protein
MVGEEFTLKVSSLGKVTDVKLPEKVLQVVNSQQNTRRGPGMGNMAGPDQIKEQIENAFVLLPEKAIEANATWDKKTSTKMPRMGTQNTDVTYTYKGQEKKGADEIAKIDAKTQLTFEPQEGSEIDAEITEQKGTGEIAFDVTAGKVHQMSFHQKMVMNINARDREITQELESKRTLKPGKSENPPPADKKPAEKKEAAKKK